MDAQIKDMFVTIFPINGFSDHIFVLMKGTGLGMVPGDIHTIYI